MTAPDHPEPVSETLEAAYQEGYDTARFDALSHATNEEIAAELRRRDYWTDETDQIRSEAVAPLREALECAVSELDAEHRPTWSTDEAKAAGKSPIGCDICYPQDGGWPCISRMIADDLRQLLADPEVGG